MSFEELNISDVFIFDRSHLKHDSLGYNGPWVKISNKHYSHYNDIRRIFTIGNVDVQVKHIKER